MRSPQYLDISDPRLGLPIQNANLNDLNTKFAIIALQQCLAGCEGRAIAAPSIGIPVNVLGVKNDGRFFALINPRIIHVGKHVSTLTAPFPYIKNLLIKYSVPDSMRIVGTVPEGPQIVLDVNDSARVDVLNAFALFQSGDVTQWLTPFHKAYLKARNTKSAALFLNVGNNLLMTKSVANFRPALRERQGEYVDVLGRDEEVIATLHWQSPNIPENRTDLALLFLIARMGVPGNVFFNSPKSLSLALALSMAWRGVRVYFPDQEIPVAAISALGIKEYMQPLSHMRIDQTEPGQTEPTCGAAVIDLRHGANIETIDIKRLSSALHSDGCLAIISPNECDTCEKQLQKQFSYVYSFHINPNEIIYIG